MSVSEQKTSCGFVAILGVPNAGKSTLTNKLVGSKVSIVSRKVQTTRTRLMGILTQDDTQIILLDTPGIFQPKKTLEKAMVGCALDAIEEADVLIHLVDVSRSGSFEENQIIRDKLAGQKNCILVLNKIDRADKADLLKAAEKFNEIFDYKQTFMISSLKGSGVSDLQKKLAAEMPSGPWHFPEDQISDMPLRFLAAEITREQIFNRLHEELPYASLVETELWEEFDNGDIKITQIIYVQRDTQKAIVVGKGGARIKELGIAARKELEIQFSRKVHLKLHVKVQENWPERPEFYRIIGLDYAG